MAFLQNKTQKAMDEFNIVREMNELADRIDTLYKASGMLRSSVKVHVLTSVVVAKHEWITINLKNKALVTIIELEINELECRFDDLKNQLLNPKQDEQATSN